MATTMPAPPPLLPPSQPTTSTTSTTKAAPMTTAAYQSTTALLTEHFRYTPLTLLDDIINTTNELIYRAVSAVQEGLSSASPASLGFTSSTSVPTSTTSSAHPSTSSTPAADAQVSADEAAHTEIEKGTHALETLLQASVDKNFDILEIYVLRNLLRIPEGLENWVRLGHYEGLDFSASEGGREASGGRQASAVSDEKVREAGVRGKGRDGKEVEAVDKLIELRRQLLETRRLKTQLIAEKQRNAALLTQLHSLLSPPQDGQQPQPNNLSFLITSMRSLQSQSRQSQNQDADMSSSQAERSQLVSTARELKEQVPTLRALLKNLRAHQEQGVELGSQAKAGSEAERERREYLEGVVAGRVSELSGNAGNGAGLGAAGGDVRSLEGIRDLVSGSDGGGGREEGRRGG